MKTREYVILGILGILVIFQVFLRYQYVPLGKSQLVRIDRLTRQSCIEPCNGSSASPTPEPPTEAEVDADIISYMQSLYRLIHPRNGRYMWIIAGHFDRAGIPEPTNIDPSDPDFNSQDYPIRQACFCSEKMTGWWYQVIPTSSGGFNVSEITGNSVLEKKYGFTK
ncbi:MAG TPA: hypothetical protein VGZ00_09400 [Candidatus Baltobacteraceae bacterium]|nr:hypothetical protein [Candidatus Baltobacteraceae bacterium]